MQFKIVSLIFIALFYCIQGNAQNMQKGKKIYETRCLACHQANGQGIKGVFPSIDGSPLANLKENIPAHIHQVIYGKGNMPAFGEQLSDTDIASAVTFTRNNWGNKTGDIIQPKDVAAGRKK